MEHIELTEIEKQHASIIRSGLHECSLFLRKNSAFPLQNPCKLALFGNGARHTFKGGTGSGDVNSRYIVSAEEGFENAGFTITTKSYLDAYDLVIKQSDKQFVKDVKTSAKRKHVSVYMEAFGFTKLQPDYDIPLVYDSDAAIYVLSRLCGEGNDRQVAKGDFYLTDTEVREILELNDKYEKFMLVLNVGGVVDLSPVKNVSNILLLSQLGSEIGNCLADIVLGKVNPSGKLSDSWADYKSYNPDAIFDEVNDTKYNEGLYFGYRYFDSYNKEPLFPFGFGLSYSEFEILHPKLEVHSKNVSVSFDVKNISKVSGKEVVQLYVREPQGRLGKPYQKLLGFIKTPLLKEGESCSLSINMNVEDIVSFDIENSCYLLEKGQYVFKLGNSSRNTKTIGAIELKEDIVTKKVKILYPNNVKSTSIKLEDEKVDKPITLLSNVVPEVTEYKDFISPLCKNYSDEEIVNLLIGGKRDDGLLSFIGNAAMKVVGAAGESYHNVKDIPGFVFSDGPAGLRISQRVGVKGNKMRDLSANMMMATVYPFFPFIAKPIMKGFLKEKKLKKEEEDLNNSRIIQEIVDDISFATLTQKINLNDINVDLELIQMQKSKRLYVCPRFY